MKSLEKIITETYGVKRVFRKRDGELTNAGAAAYKKLETLLNDLEDLGVIKDAAAAVRVMDEITHENY